MYFSLNIHNANRVKISLSWAPWGIHWLCYSGICHKARNCISSLQKLGRKQLVLCFSVELWRENSNSDMGSEWDRGSLLPACAASLTFHVECWLWVLCLFPAEWFECWKKGSWGREKNANAVTIWWKEKILELNSVLSYSLWPERAIVRYRFCTCKRTWTKARMWNRTKQISCHEVFGADSLL